MCINLWRSTLSEIPCDSIHEAPNSEGADNRSNKGEGEDGADVTEEVLFLHGITSVEDDWGEEDVEEEVGSELGERVGIGIEGVGDEDSEQSSDKDENTRLWKEPFKDGEMVEEDLEDDGEDDQA